MRNFYTGAILIALSLAACTQASEDLEALKSEVIKAHDRIMPRNVELIRSEAGLSDLLSSLDSLKEAKPETDTLLLRHQADSLIHNLNAADNAMSEWMYAFQVDYTDMEHEAVMEYLNAEKAKITGIEKAYDESIEAARELLDSIAKK